MVNWTGSGGTAEEKNEIRLEAVNLDVEETTYASPCPRCGERSSFSITRTPSGILYICHRVSCGIRGFIPSNSPTTDSPRERPQFSASPFREKLTSLPEDLLAWLDSEYELDATTVARNGWKYAPYTERLYMPTTDYFGQHTGAVAKRLPGSIYEGAKVINYREKEGIRLHFPITQPAMEERIVVVVEDVMSSVKVSKVAPSCALLGTSMNDEQAGFLASHYDKVVLALDPDAINKAMKLQSRFTSIFKRGLVLRLFEKDPKDTPLEVIQHVVDSVKF